MGGAYFSSLGINMQQACKLFQTLDSDKSGSIDIEEFTDGCLRLKGEATTVDMAILHHEIHLLQHSVSRIVDILEEQRNGSKRPSRNHLESALNAEAERTQPD